MLRERAERVSGSSAETKEREKGIREGGWRGAAIVHLKHHTLICQHGRVQIWGTSMGTGREREELFSPLGVTVASLLVFVTL